MKKFETARKLKTKISKIRAKYTKELTSDDDKVRQRATALYVIDHLALRVGNEKDEDEADTVGCCSLRVEHVTLKAPKTIEFDFLGKDSMRYQNSVEVEEQVFKNFKKFTKGKKKDDDIFDELTTTALNAYLKEQMEGLTAKVFRTYNASITLENELAKIPEEAENWTVDEKMLFYNRANREVAILCNHQRSVGKNFGAQIGKLDSQIQELEDQKTELKDHIKVLKGDTPKKRKREVKEEEEEDGSPKKKQKLPNDVEKCKKAIAKLDERIAKWNIKKQEKDDLKTVALTTSKINYIDPRVSVSWAKKWDVPIEKIFSKTLREKFPWAMDVEDFVF
jgi:DNA topoisomerase-1